MLYVPNFYITYEKVSNFSKTNSKFNIYIKLYWTLFIDKREKEFIHWILILKAFSKI